MVVIDRIDDKDLQILVLGERFRLVGSESPEFRNCDIVTMIRVFIQSLQHDIPDQEQHDAGYGYVDQ